uniref:Polyadenylate-binding protein n=1 Tax=Wollemia nobilis TaxID=56998 RepID=A0A0C9RIN6_9CONI
MAVAVAVAPSFPTSVSLYVGDLDAGITEANLTEHFGKMGILTSVRVCRDTMTQCSLGYGYVNFMDPAEAGRALDALNYTKMNGKPIRIMWSHRDPLTRKSGVGNIFIKNLHESVTHANLHETFNKFGNILSCKVAMQDGKSRGYGFVHFESEESANAAIENMDGTTIEGKQVYVGKFIKRQDRMGSSADQKFTNLFIKNLEKDVTEELLSEKFSKHGKIVNIVIMKDENGNSKGFGFVNFDNPDDAKKAVESMDGSQLGSKVIYVGRAQKKAERAQILRRQFEEKRQERILKYQGSNVYVKNIDDGVDDEELQTIFGQYGTIVSTKIMRDDKGISKGFGFVCFGTPEEANKALAELSGHMLHNKPLYVAIAQRKEVRRAQLQAQWQARISHPIPGLSGPGGAVLPPGYPAMYYAAPGVVSQIPQRQGIMYPPMGVRPGWRPAGALPPSRAGYQPMAVAMVPSNPRQQRQPRARVNGPTLPQPGQPMNYVSSLQQQAMPPSSYKDVAGNQQQRQWQSVKYVPNGRPREMNNTAQASGPATGFTSQTMINGSASLVGANPVPVANQGANEMLSSLLAAGSLQEQKQMLGERLFPLVQQHQFELAGKITGMLLEMDNSELLLLLESPDALQTKVQEAVNILNLSKPNLPAQDANSGSFLAGEVAVN